MADERFIKPGEVGVRGPGAALTESPRPRGKELWVYAAIWGFALLLRAIYLWQIKDAPVLSTLMSDAQSYDAWAQEIARGNWLGDQVFYQAPLYPYFLGLLYALLGHSLVLVRVVQVVLGATSCLFIGLAGRLFFSRRIGLLAGALLAMYPSAIYFDGLIQKSVLDLFLLSLFLFGLGLANQEPRPRWWLVCGALLGLLTLSRENALALFFVMVFWLWVRHRPEPLARRMQWAGLALAGLMLVLFPVALRNKVVGGEFHLTTSQFGPNFYIGNNKKANGFYESLRPGRSNPRFERQDATDLAETALGRKLSPAEVSRYWTGQALSDIRRDPGNWLRLMARKWFLVWNAIEIADAEDQYTYGDSSSLLRGLSLVFHFGILCPLAILGIALTWQERGRLWVLYLMLASYAASVAFFYVFARYRFPLVAWLVLFAAAGLIQGWNLLRERRFAAVLAATGLAVAAGVFVNWRSSFTPDEFKATTEYNIAFKLSKHGGKIDEVITHYRAALRLSPDFVEAHNDLAKALVAQGKLDEAITQYDEALRLKPDLAEAHFNLGNVFAVRGRLELAVAHYREALRFQPGWSEAHNNLGLALASQGQLQEAMAQYTEALRLKPANAEAHNNLGLALAIQGKAPEAIAHYQEALRLEPDYVVVLNNLARILATNEDERARNPVEALRLAIRACELTENRDSRALDTLAAAYAAAGRFPEAIQTGQKAAELAIAAGKQPLARAILKRLESYKLGKPIRERSMEPFD